MSQFIAPIIAVGLVSLAVFWTSFRFGDSEDLFISTLGQVFHGLGMASLLVILGIASRVSTSAANEILNPFLIVMTVIVVMYILLMTSRAIIMLVTESYGWFTNKIRGKDF